MFVLEIWHDKDLRVVRRVNTLQAGSLKKPRNAWKRRRTIRFFYLSHFAVLDPVQKRSDRVKI